MDEKELVAKLQLLKQVKPRSDWVVLTKAKILTQDQTEQQHSKLPQLALNQFIFPLFSRRGIVFSGLTLLIVVLVGLGVWSLNSSPGDTLYPAKKAVQRINLLAEDPVTLHLKLAAQSAKTLKEIAQKNDTEKLAPAIKEYQENIKKVAASLSSSTSTEDGRRVLEIAKQVNEIEQTAKEIEQILQTEIAKKERKEMLEKTLAMVSAEVQELTGGYRAQVERQLEDISQMPLNEEQQGLLERAREEFESGDYELAQKTINLILQLFEEQ